MKKKLFVADLREGLEVSEAFLVQSKNLAYARNGKPYLSLTLADRTGTIEARVWDEAEEATRRFVQQDFIVADGRVVEYNGRLQLSVSRVRRLSPQEAAVEEFLPRTPSDIEALWAELSRIVAEMKNPHLRALVQLFLEDPAFARDFRTAPAAKGIHHVYVGGLLEHSLSVALLARRVAAHYTAIHGDLLVAAAVLHDAGKIAELSYETGFDYTPEGRLLGHTVLVLRWIDEKLARLPDFPEETALHLKHIVASHHGTAEFGAIKPPSTPEAVVFHLIDNIDAKLWTFLKAVKEAEDDPGAFTPFHRVLDLFIYKGDAAGRGEGGYGFRMESPAPREEARPERTRREPAASPGLFDDVAKKR